MREEMDVHLLCDDIIQATERIRDYTRDVTYESFLQDIKTQDAVIRNLEIVGEAVKNLPKSFKEQFPEIPWRFISGMQDKLIHHYFGVSGYCMGNCPFRYPCSYGAFQSLKHRL